MKNLETTYEKLRNNYTIERRDKNHMLFYRPETFTINVLVHSPPFFSIFLLENMFVAYTFHLISVIFSNV